MDCDIATHFQSARPPHIVKDHPRSLPRVSSARLVQHDARMRQGIALPLCASGEQERAHARSLADADCRDGRADVLHGIVDGEACGDGAAGGVDVEVDLLVGGLALEEEELGDDGGREAIVDGAIKTYDTLLQQARVNVVCGR